VYVEEMTVKFLVYQIVALAVIWCGMFFFFDELYDSGRTIFYILTSWLLFLLVLLGKELKKRRKQ